MKQMSLSEFILYVREQGLVYIGNLMSPEEVAAALQDRSEFEKTQISGWYLCGEFHPDMWKHAQSKRESIKTHLIVRGPTPDDPMAYAIFVQEIGLWQHRILLPLLGQSVGKLVESIQTSPVGLSLGDDESNRALILPINVPPSAVSEIRKYVQADLVKPVETLEAATLMAFLLTAPIGPFLSTGPSIQHACVTLILPPELLAIAEATIKGKYH